MRHAARQWIVAVALLAVAIHAAPGFAADPGTWREVRSIQSGFGNVRAVALAPDGEWIAVGATTAFVAVGGKAEAAIDVTEFRDAASGEIRLAVGDEIEATVVDDGSRSGTITLKRVAGRGGHVPGELEQAFAHGIAVEGLVTGENKGGYDVQIGTVRAFYDVRGG